MSAPISFTCSLDPEDLIDAYSLQVRPRPAFWYMGAGFLLLLAVLFLGWSPGRSMGRRATFLAIVTGIVGASLFWFYRIYIPRYGRRAHAHHKFLRGLIRVLVDDVGIQLHTDHMNLMQPWSHFVSWKENGNLFLLCESDLMFSLVFPKRCMDPETIEGLRGILSSRVSTGA